MIFVTNDDGIHSDGLWTLVSALEKIDEVYVAAPDRERSAIGMAITLHQTLRAIQIRDRAFSVTGTPVDCVDLAVGGLLPEKPSLLVSGINKGQNLGHDVLFSGTIAAAIKGTFLKIPSIAVSLVLGEAERVIRKDLHFQTAAAVASQIVRKVLENGLPEGVLINVNVPNLPYDQLLGIEITRQDKAPYNTKVSKRIDPRGIEYYWIGGDREEIDPSERIGTDFKAVHDRRVSITPLQLDLTDRRTMEILKGWNLQL